MRLASADGVSGDPVGACTTARGAESVGRTTTTGGRGVEAAVG